ncbi:GAF domain-containing sensor histidine kinase [Desulfomicrobium escambiense]|uniref:GAF domain-containing sensor histidine kinase n=1 Tax=Desulfomicrobium escambiense TaxID=29503 RepID=UPI000423D169|nr:GAF domain-containing sensor histidine kinase [Desulfomicrobium escambiense]
MPLPNGIEPDLGLFLRRMMGILACRSKSPAEKLRLGGVLIQERLGSSQASVMLFDEDRQELKVVAATRQEIVGLCQPLSPRCVSGYVCTFKEPLLITDIAADGRFCCRSAAYRTASLMSVPLLSEQGSVIGVINVSDKEGGGAFSQADLGLLLEYAGWVTPLIDNIVVLDRLEKEKERYRDLAQELEIKQKELIMASTERAELVQMVVHDFKSPLSAVISNMDLLTYLGPSESQRPIIETAFKGASKLLEMIDEFLHVARVDELHERGFSPMPVSFLPLVESQLAEIAPLARDKGIVIENGCALDVRVLGDRMLLGHLVQNLVSNAVKYTPENGLIRLGMDSWESRRTEDPSRTVLKFWVEDNGEGIEDRYKETVFEKFVRTERSMESGIKGTGIGLFVCRKIVSMFQGRIWVEDATPKGSRFCVILFIPDSLDGNEHG